jgi:UDPglucose 6-dehydrogenase
MVMCDNLHGTNCEDVMKGLFMADKRIISKNYLNGGMGDGGGCHPRDNIALSWLSKSVGLKYDFYEGLMKTREYQTEYFADKINTIKVEYPELPIILLGKSFKPDTNITTGSPAILLANMMTSRGYTFSHQDHMIDSSGLSLSVKAIYFLCTKHSAYENLQFPDESIVVDPFRYVKKTVNIRYLPVGISN